MNTAAKALVVEHDDEQRHVPAVAESGAIFAIIERAARDPNVDIDKMERLLLMQERVLARNAKAAFASALAEMQPKLPVIGRRGVNTNTKQAYAKWEDIAESIAPVLAAHGFALTFKVNRADGMVSVTGFLFHEQGHSEETTLDLPVDTGPGRNAVQAVGSSVSYGKRYVAGALLNFVSRDMPDDDGNTSTDAPAFITDEQVVQLRELLDAKGADTAKFLKFIKLERLEQIHASAFQRVIDLVNTYKKG